jgi:hypothetical protein
MAASIPAEALHLDQLLAVKDGALVVGYYDFGTSQGGVNRVPFKQLFGTSAGFPYQGNPGWNAVSSGLPAGFSPLPPNTDVGFNVVTQTPTFRNLSYWSGTGPITWLGPTNAKLLIQKQTGPSTYLLAIADGGFSAVPGYTVARTTGTGAFHQHLDFFLLDSSNGGNPPDGVYLVAIVNTMAGLASSDPSYVVFGKGVSQAVIDQAATWVDVNLISDCTDRADNDGDGKVDYGTGAANDPGCGGTSPGFLENPQCSDGLDNDGDTFVDFPADAQCTSLSSGAEAPSACGLLGIEVLLVPAAGLVVRRVRRGRS